MRKSYKFTYVFAAIAALILFMFSSFAIGGARIARAATVVTTSYEQNNVLDDLKGSTIDGEPFSLEEYGFDKNKNTQLLSFIEFGYSYYNEMQHDFGLYVYVYNPQGINYVTGSPLNKIRLIYGGNESDKSDKYSMQFLNQSTATGYEGLFYKYKIVLSEIEREDILSKVDSGERIYEVTEIELLINGDVNATAYTVAKKYRYSGYSENHGPLDMEGSSLDIKVDGVENYLELEVNHTVYRPKGDYYNGKQSQLNSCYFRVPEKYFSEYGELTNIGCEWYEYITQPILVTETDYLYRNLYNLHGASVNNFNSDMYFMIVLSGNTDQVGSVVKTFDYLGFASNYKQFDSFYLFPFADGVTSLSWSGLDKDPGRFYNFSAVFSTDGSSYKDRRVSPEELTEQLLANSEVLGGSKINGKYSESLFSDTVDSGHSRGYNRKDIGKDDLFDVFWNRTTKSVLQSWFGGYDVETEYDTINALEEITADKLIGTNSEISKRLYISEDDVDDLKSEFEKCKDERLILFRFGSSEYYSMPCWETFCSKYTDNADNVLVKDILQDFSRDNYTAYAARETVYLDFDIIYLTYTLGNIKMNIPVISSPTDAIAGIDPPLEQDYHNTNSGGCAGAVTVSIIMIVVASAILVILIFKFILWVRKKVNESKKE